MKRKVAKPERITSFNLKPGRLLANKFAIVGFLGAGWESEVYRVRELSTGIDRAAKIFFPHRNIGRKTSDRYANKLNRLGECPVVIRYHGQEAVVFQKQLCTVLISEYVQGELLSEYFARKSRKRLSIFQAVHLLHALTAGIVSIHRLGEYHGDFHDNNVIVRRVGLSYDLKFLDFFHWGPVSKANRDDDICNVIRIFYDALGGPKTYAKHPRQIKEICLGLHKSKILKKFRTGSELKLFIENLQWEDGLNV